MEAIQVAIRIRPFLPGENEENTTIAINPEDDRKINISKSTKNFQGYFDKIFFNESTQAQIYSFVKPAILGAKRGINCTIFAYGQTGSGKTYTIFGEEWTLNRNSNNYYMKKQLFKKDEYNFLYDKDFFVDAFNETNGIIPRVIIDLFKNPNKEKIDITCSYIQIYNEKIYDLLEEENDLDRNKLKKNFVINFNSNINIPKPIKSEPLKIRDDKIRGIVLDNCREVEVQSFYDVFELLRRGEINRKKRTTNKNEMSSRSHTIFIINYTNISKQIRSKINLCDLAGSERYNTKETYKTIHINELKNINKSLSILGNVISALASKKKNVHVPYKESKLTHLLMDSLGGNFKTYLIATISPDERNFDESYNTLLFADRAHNVMTKVSVNELVEHLDGSSNNNKNSQNAIVKLTKEVNELKEILNVRKKRGNLEPIEEEVVKLKIENKHLRNIVNKQNPRQIQKLMAENKYLKKELSKYTQKNLTSSSIFSQDKKQNSRDILTNTGKNIVSNYYNNNNHNNYNNNNNNNYNNNNNNNNNYNNNNNMEKNLFDKRQMGNKNNFDFEDMNIKPNPKNYSAQYSNNNLLNYNNIKPNKFKTTDRLKMLDEMEKQNILKTQALIQQINNNSKKNNNKNINFSAPKSNPNKNKYKLNNINSYISENDVNDFY